jgi:hypothetical protein
MNDPDVFIAVPCYGDMPPDGPATPKQIAIARALAASCKLELVISSPTRREAASEIQALRCVADISRQEK